MNNTIKRIFQTMFIAFLMVTIMYMIQGLQYFASLGHFVDEDTTHALDE